MQPYATCLGLASIAVDAIVGNGLAIDHLHKRGSLGIQVADTKTTQIQGTGFCNTYSQFLACRALFGIAMGGLYGNAAATALEDLPEEARGLMSGLLQQGVSRCHAPTTATYHLPGPKHLQGPFH